MAGRGFLLHSPPKRSKTIGVGEGPCSCRETTAIRVWLAGVDMDTLLLDGVKSYMKRLKAVFGTIMNFTRTGHALSFLSVARLIYGLRSPY